MTQTEDYNAVTDKLLGFFHLENDGWSDVSSIEGEITAIHTCTSAGAFIDDIPDRSVPCVILVLNNDEREFRFYYWGINEDTNIKASVGDYVYISEDQLSLDGSTNSSCAIL
jgi:hypothetical protein